MNAIERYNNQDEDNATMQLPNETTNGLYIWENWMWDGNSIKEIRYFSQDVHGNEKVRRISTEDYLYLLTRLK